MRDTLNSPPAEHEAAGLTSRALPAASPNPEAIGLEVATWNTGGESEEQCRDFLPGLIDSHEELRRVQILLIQQAIQQDNLAVPTLLRGWTLALFKSEQEWRGQGILARTCMGTLGQLQGALGALAAVVGEGDERIGIVTLHLPTKATIEETESMLAEWGAMGAMQQKKLVVGFDCNETCDFDGEQVLSRTARGESILIWAIQRDLSLPCQQRHVPSFFPYNTAQQPRRLDYVLTKGLQVGGEGRVLGKTRTMMESDHDAVAISLAHRSCMRFCPRTTSTAPKSLKSGDLSCYFTLRTEMTCEWVQHISGEITQSRRRKTGFQESIAIKRLRLQARQASNTRQAATLWKSVWKMRHNEKRE